MRTSALPVPKTVDGTRKREISYQMHWNEVDSPLREGEGATQSMARHAFILPALVEDRVGVECPTKDVVAERGADDD
jgi:hypothetical protein